MIYVRLLDKQIIHQNKIMRKETAKRNQSEVYQQIVKATDPPPKNPPVL